MYMDPYFNQDTLSKDVQKLRTDWTPPSNIMQPDRAFGNMTTWHHFDGIEGFRVSNLHYQRVGKYNTKHLVFLTEVCRTDGCKMVTLWSIDPIVANRFSIEHIGTSLRMMMQTHGFWMTNRLFGVRMIGA